MDMEEYLYSQVLLKEPYCVNAYEKEKSYLLSLEPKRLLAGFLETAGLPTAASRYPGWEETEIQGHTLGHYLAAVSQVYASEKTELFGARIQMICDTLKKCQRADGYLFAWKEEIFDRVEQNQPAWVPWYTLHKILSGLLLAYQLAGSQTAYEIADRLGDWVSRRTAAWTAEVRTQVLSVEYGGMNDALYDLYRLTGKKHHLEAAMQFDEEQLFQKIYENQDVLNGLHANTTIPQILESMNRYLITGEPYYFTVAENFWSMVTEHHTYITGGNSEWEHFGEPDILDGERTACNCETCNTYNMLKLTKRLYMATTEKRYMDFYEKTWLNAIVGSQNPQTGMTMYFQPMETGFFKVYQEPYSSFWCCTGTGMENFTKLQDSIYFKEDGTLYITRYLSSKLRSETGDLLIQMDAAFPECSRVKLQIGTSAPFDRICLRIPEWSQQGARAEADGKKLEVMIKNGYLYLDSEPGKTVHIHFFPKIRAHVLPDNPRVAAFTYGPAVLCAKLGTALMDTTVTGVQVKIPTKSVFIRDYLILEDETPEEWLADAEQNMVRNPDELSFSPKGIKGEKMVFVPYYRQHGERYGIYWYLYKSGSKELERRREDLKQNHRLMRESMDLIPIGNDQYELAHRIKGENTLASRLNGVNYRQIQGIGYFQYEMKIQPGECFLEVVYSSEDAGSTFDILVDGTLLCHERLAGKSDEFYKKSYRLTKELSGTKETVTVTFRTETEDDYCRIFKVLYVCKKTEEVEEEAK